MESGIIALLVIAGLTVVASAFIGLRAQGWLGASLLGGGSAIASGLCVAATWLGRQRWGDRGGWIGLAAGILLVAFLTWHASNRVLRGDSGRFAVGMWLAFCGSCLFGYLAGGWVGLLTIALPAIVVFWLGLFRVSAYILPLDKRHRPRAFRTLLTFTMGTNYPYYAVRNGQVEERVKGNAYNQFFAGPGLVWVDVDQAAYLTDGVHVRGVLEPGVHFTGVFDREPKAIDLRPQLCTVDVHAITQDGIPVDVKAFVPFRLHPGSEVHARHNVRAEPALGRSFPFRRRSVHQIAARELVEKRDRETTSGDRLEWTTSLVPLMTTRILQDIVSQHNVDDLCAPLDPELRPSDGIVRAMRQRLHRTLAPLGLELEGGWLGNLRPQDEVVNARRVDNWKTEWERQILLHMSESRADRARQIERARAQAELKILFRFAQVAQSVTLGDPASQTALALRFIDCLGEIVSESEGQWPIPEGLRDSLKELRGEIEEGGR